ncbi:MAG: ABC transporter permease [Chlamydiales bacterium]|nr:ABC transporter permease [Chlamydiales bacterium]
MKKKYLVRKIFILAGSLFIVATMTFFLMQAAPGDPFMQEQAVPEEIMKSMYAHYGLDQPWYIQYVKYLKGLITWDLGPSFKYEGRTVNDIIREGFPVSLILGLEAITLSLFTGIILGTIAAIRRSRWQDHVAMIVAVIGISVPNFIMATFLQYLFAMKLDLFPVARWGGLSHTILPALSLAALPTAFIARLTRANMVEVLEQDYVQTALSKGLSTRQVVFKHVLKNSLLPVITYIGPLSSAILTGSFIVEKIFGIPGLGGWFVTSITNRDYTVIMGVTMFYSAILMLCVFLVDLLYTLLDPRIQIGKTKVMDE